ncbi:MAG: hypothetical protein ACC608_09515 [Anaerofustis sp.]
MSDSYIRGHLKAHKNNSGNGGKPPHGIEPRFIHDEKRLELIDSAIIRYFSDKRTIPEVWIHERNEIIEGMENE